MDQPPRGSGQASRRGDLRAVLGVRRASGEGGGVSEACGGIVHVSGRSQGRGEA